MLIQRKRRNNKNEDKLILAGKYAIKYSEINNKLYNTYTKQTNKIIHKCQQTDKITVKCYICIG